MDDKDTLLNVIIKVRDIPYIAVLLLGIASIVLTLVISFFEFGVTSLIAIIIFVNPVILATAIIILSFIGLRNNK